jgi:hypothetical protein
MCGKLYRIKYRQDKNLKNMLIFLRVLTFSYRLVKCFEFFYSNFEKMKSASSPTEQTDSGIGFFSGLIETQSHLTVTEMLDVRPILPAAS